MGLTALGMVFLFMTFVTVVVVTGGFAAFACWLISGLMRSLHTKPPVFIKGEPYGTIGGRPEPQSVEEVYEDELPF